MRFVASVPRDGSDDTGPLHSAFNDPCGYGVTGEAGLSFFARSTD